MCVSVYMYVLVSVCMCIRVHVCVHGAFLLLSMYANIILHNAGLLKYFYDYTNFMIVVSLYYRVQQRWS